MLIEILGFITLLTHIAIVLGLLLLWLRPEHAIVRFVKTNALFLGFVVAVSAASGSMYFSSVALLEPCLLCWYQRIFMFPQVVILAVGIWLQERSSALIALVLSVVGGLISVYHVFIQWQERVGLDPTTIVTCATDGSGPSCESSYFLLYGYITIPVMTLTAFVLLGILGWLGYKELQAE